LKNWKFFLTILVLVLGGVLIYSLYVKPIKVPKPGDDSVSVKSSEIPKGSNDVTINDVRELKILYNLATLKKDSKFIDNQLSSLGLKNTSSGWLYEGSDSKKITRIILVDNDEVSVSTFILLAKQICKNKRNNNVLFLTKHHPNPSGEVLQILCNYDHISIGNNPDHKVKIANLIPSNLTEINKDSSSFIRIGSSSKEDPANTIVNLTRFVLSIYNLYDEGKL